MEDLTFKRCMKPEKATSEDPTLVIFSDGSEIAYGAVAYARWKLEDGTIVHRLWLVKLDYPP